MEWVRVLDTSKYIDSEDYISDEDDHALVRRLYRKKGRQYPLLCVAIYANSSYSINKEPFEGIKIAFSYKEKRGDWWDDYSAYLPPELFSDLQEMLAEVIDKVK